MNVVSHVKQQLHENIDPNTKMYSRSVFKEEIKSLGVKVPVVNGISKMLFKQIEHLSKDTIFGYCEELLKSI